MYSKLFDFRLTKEQEKRARKLHYGNIKILGGNWLRVFVVENEKGVK